MKTYLSLSCLLLFFAGAVIGQPVLLKKFPSYAGNLKAAGNVLYFTTSDSLLKSDGTTAGTIVVKTGLNGPGHLYLIGNLLYFLNNGNKEIWRSDGTNAGTYMLLQSDQKAMSLVTSLGSYLYFIADAAASGSELYRTDGTTTGTILLKDINAGPSDGVISARYAAIGNTLFFAGTDAGHGTELWKTDGTSDGTVLVKDINPGTDSSMHPALLKTDELIAAGGEVYFPADDGVHGVELWKSDGTADGTLLVKDLTEGRDSSQIYVFGALNQNAFFVRSGTGTSTGLSEIWKTDGSEAGTVLLDSILQTDFFNEYLVTGPMVFKGRLYFFTLNSGNFSADFWGSDGTPAGTGMVMPNISTSDAVWYSDTLNNQMVFLISDQEYMNLWKSDGTNAGTSKVYRFHRLGLGQDMPDLAKSGNLLFFADNASGYDVPDTPDDYLQLFRTDLTQTIMLRNLYGKSFVGTHEIEAVNGRIFFTTNNDLASQDSTMLYVLAPGANHVPVVNITAPLNNAGFTAPASITITATATDQDGSVTKVQFYNGSALLGEDTSAPYAYTWNNIAAGTYTITAIAIDDLGGKDTSAAVTIKVNASPVVDISTSAPNITLAAPATFTVHANASDADGTIAGVAFYNGNTLLATDNTSPYSYTFTQVPAGTYKVKAVATDDKGAQDTSAVITIIVEDMPNALPEVTISSPQEQETLVAPAAITLNAEASDTDGTVAKVQFYSGNTLLGEDVTAPYSYTWENVPAGTYMITAVATDDKGGKGVSSALTFKVNTSTGISYGMGIFSGVYPNPSYNAFMVKTSEPVKSLRVMNMYGEEALALYNLPSGQVMEVGDALEAGAYIMQVEYTSERIERVNLIKIR